VAIGMEVEDAFEDEAPRLYTVTDVAEGKVVLDGNHPLAGIALRFVCEVVDVRTAKPEEIRQGVSLPQA
jgi:FKBP-type peptidyl-prolyl cis-trans isomerase SlyD